MKEYPLDPDVQAAIAGQARLYAETDGKEGGWVEEPGQPPAPVLLLTTRGRRTGQPRTTPLIFGRDGSDYLVVASLAGYDKSPQWYLNLLAEPRAEIQVLAERLAVTARSADADERERLWRLMSEVYPTYETYQAATSRAIPVVVLAPAAD